MDPQRLLEALLEFAHRVGLEVRSQALRGTHPSAGGLVRLNGRELVLLNSKTSPVDRCTALADALIRKQLDGNDASLEVRKFLMMRARSLRGVIAPTNLPGPGLAKTAAKKLTAKPTRRI